MFCDDATALSGTKIVLVDNLFYSGTEFGVSTDFSPHLGLMALASICSAAGADCEIVDPKVIFSTGKHAFATDQFFSHASETILQHKPDIVGFTAYGMSFPYAAAMARALKTRSIDSSVIIGGPHATLHATRLLELHPEFDLVAMHECEKVIVPIVRALKDKSSLKHISNISYRDQGRIVQNPRDTLLPSGDELPKPDFSFYDENLVRNSELPIEAGRGCPFECTFCSTANFFSRRYRIKSTESLIAEIVELNSRHGTVSFDLNHDLFGLRKRDLIDFCHQILPLSFSWRCSMRPDTLHEDILSLMKQAGCTHIYFGFEVGTQRMQIEIKKRLDVNRSIENIQLAASLGINCDVSFITGFPTETVDDQNASLDVIGLLLKSYPRAIMPQLHILSPEPGSELGATETSELLFDGFGPEGEFIDRADLITQDETLNAVFYHYASGVNRNRCLLATVFISRLVPKLGHELVNHIVTSIYEGSLSKFFSDVFIDAPIARAPNAVEKFLDACFEVWLKRQATEIQQTYRFITTVNASSSPSVKKPYIQYVDDLPHFHAADLDPKSTELILRLYEQPQQN